ncbi:MAG TPA: dihydroorotate dehydrogenase [Actinomycetota bacterium]
MAGVKHSLAVDLGGLHLPLPVVAAAGCFGTGRELAGLTDLRTLGGVVTRSLTYQPSKGALTPRVAESPSGIVTAVGAQNPGVRDFLAEDLPKLRRTGLPVIASVAGSSLEEYVRVASALQSEPGIVALEVYLGTRDEQHGGIPFASRRELMVDVVGAVSRLSSFPVFAKLSAVVPDLEETARACVHAGAHGLTLIDAVPAMAVDASRLRPRLGATLGGLSGPAIRPIALAAVFRVAQVLPGVPIMGVGGVSTGEDAVEFLLAGASAVQVGTALLVNPAAPEEITRGILAYLKDKGVASPGDLRGRLRTGGEGPEA